MEVCRLDAWVRHEDQLILSAVNAARDPHLAAELHCHHAEHRHVNVLHCTHISAIYRLKGYSGPGPFMPDDPVSLEEQSDDNEALVDKDDHIQDEVLRLGDFLDTLTIS